LGVTLDGVHLLLRLVKVLVPARLLTHRVPDIHNRGGAAMIRTHGFVFTPNTKIGGAVYRLNAGGGCVHSVASPAQEEGEADDETRDEAGVAAAAAAAAAGLREFLDLRFQGLVFRVRPLRV